MLKCAFCAGLLIAVPSLAIACPDTGGGDKVFELTATELWATASIEVVAGVRGDDSVDLSQCPELTGIGARGYVITNPDIELNYIKDVDHELEFRVSGQCDTVLLINDPSGDFYFSDDLNGVDPSIRFADPNGGPYDVWVGTFGSPTTCNSAVEVETFAPISSAPPK